MTQNTRELFILGKWGKPQDDDYLVLVSGWKQKDGSISTTMNCTLRPGTQFYLTPVKNKRTPTSPDFIYGCRRNQISIEDGQVEVLAPNGE